MPLKNSQYNAITRRYDQIRFENSRQLEARRQEVYTAVPRIRQLDEDMARIAAEYARKAVSSKGGASIKDFKEDMARLARQRQELMKENGFPSDYLELKYHCPDCQDTGFIGNEKCHCFKQAIVDLVYAQSNIRQRLMEENFDTFRLDLYSTETDRRLGISPRKNMENILSCCRDFIKNFDQTHENLLFCGNTGVGKTFLSNCIARELLDSAHTVIYLTAFQLVDIMESNTFGRDADDLADEDMFDYIFDCDLLIIDDLGTELNNSFITSQLFLCINERLLRRKSTIISTNLSLEKLQREYSERIFSRIISNYRILAIFGDDIRVKKAIDPQA